MERSLIILAFLLIPQTGFPQSVPLQLIKVGAYENPPKIYSDTKGEALGIFPDILEVIARQEGWQLKYVFGSWEQCLNRLKNNEIDIMVDIAHSAERENHFIFSKENVILNWGTVYTSKEFKAESLLDLKGRTVAIVREDIHTVGESGIIKLAKKFNLNLNYLPVDSYHDALEMVNTGRAEAGVVNRLFGTVSEKNYILNKSNIVFNPVELKFAFSPNSKDAKIPDKIDHNLNRLKKDPGSVFHKIINAYLAGVEYDLTAYYEIKPFHLSAAELAWLKGHPVIRLGVDQAYAPYSFKSAGGTYQGFAVDIANLISQRLGITFEIVKDLTWPQILAGAKNKTLDVVLTAVNTQERKEYLNFTEIYLPTPLVIMAKEDNEKIEGPEDLGGKTVALVTGYASVSRILKEHPKIIPLMVDTPLAGLSSVSVSESDCYIGVLGVNDYSVRKNGISNLKVAARYDMQLLGQCMGIRKDWEPLAAILNKALGAISEKKKIELHGTWISSQTALTGAAALQDANALSAEETAWAMEHQQIKLGIDPEFAPFEFFNQQGEPQGIVSEYVRILNQRLGLNMQVVPGLTWSEAVTRAEKGLIDALPCVGKTHNREKFLDFSIPYMNYSRIIITRNDMPFISSLEDITHLRMAVQQGSSHEGYLHENSEFHTTAYPTLVETLKAVSEGKEDAMVGNLASALFWIRKEHLLNLKVAGPVSYSSEHLYFAVRSDWPKLVGILNKGLASISPSKEKKIREKWIHVEYEPGMDPKKILGYLFQGLGAVILIISIILIWNHSLKKEIRRRKEVEKDLQDSIALEELLFEMASHFITLTVDEMEKELKGALGKIIAFMSADSAYVFTLSDDKKYVQLSHCCGRYDQEEIEGQMLSMESLPFAEQLYGEEAFSYEYTGDGPVKTSVEADLLNSILEGRDATIIPMLLEDQFSGMLLFSSMKKGGMVSQTDNEVMFFKAVGYIFANTIQRCKMQLALQRYQDSLEKRIEHRTADLENANIKLLQEIEDRKRMEAEKKKLRIQLMQAQKMESLGTLAGGIAHDFNNILSGIFGYSQLAQMQIKNPEKAIQHIEQVVMGAKRATELTQQILTFSRQTQYQRRAVRIFPDVDDALKLIRSSIPATIEIKKRLDSTKKILADPIKIHQVVMNLCTNAYHAMEETGGCLTVLLTDVELTNPPYLQDNKFSPGEYVKLEINDTGHGMDEKTLERAFDPYYTTKDAGHGTGLGLALVQAIVEEHDGFLEVQSQPKKGTRFSIYFPIVKENSEKDSPETDVDSPLKGNETIMVVDDEAVIRRLHKETLEYFGYEVHVFENGSQALKAFKEDKNKFDLLVTDMTMPGLTGDKLSAEILKIKPGLPIILCSGFNDAISESKAMEIGIVKYIQKPVENKKLLGAIREIFDGKV
ncbi:MAG: transporter substrate-binding domain-containing protein [Desulfobacterium sp.]|nr:transporter substrate-binding domain-containing protein [Desulfobacterium sp.]